MCGQQGFPARAVRGWRAAFLATAFASLLPCGVSAQAIEWEALFSDGFESGDLGAWDAVGNASGGLSASGTAAMSGSFGLEAQVSDRSGLYVQDDTPTDESYYRATFRLDPNGFDPGETLSHRRTRVFIGFEDGPRRLFAVVLRRIAGQYSMTARVLLDNDTRANTGFVDITDEPHDIELYWRRASGPDANDGTFELSIDGVSSTLVGLDNSLSSVDFVRMGALSVKDGADGSMHWDDFGSFRNVTAARAQLVLNEVDYDQSGSDTHEFIEIYNAGPAFVSLEGTGMLLVNGADDTPYLNVPLQVAGTLAPGQYLVIASNAVVVDPAALVIRFALVQDNIQNGAPDGIVLGTSPDGTCVDVLDALSYEGAMTAVPVPGCGTLNLVEGTAATAEDETSVVGSLSRLPNGSDTDDANVDWMFSSTPTPGAPNVP
jgi:hypothetical protein